MSTTQPETAPDTDNPEAGGEEEKQPLTLDVNIEKPSACERHISVTVSRDDIDRFFADAVKELVPKAVVPGFREGHAPKQLVEKRFRRELADQVKGELLMASIEQVTDDESLSAISEPDFDYEAVELPDDGPMTFEFDLEVRPDFDMPQWKGLKIERPTREFTPDDVENHLKKMLRKHAQLIEKEDGEVNPGDYVNVEVTFTKDGEQVAHIEDETAAVLSELSFFDGKVEGFDKLMKGAKVGETRNTKLRLSSDAPNEELRGEEIEVEFKVLLVLEFELPELDGEILERLGNFDNEGDLRDAIKEHLDRQLTYQQNQRVREQITSLLTESADWDLPPDLLRRQSNRELERAVLELQRSGFSEAEIRQHEHELRQNSQENTARALKEHFILERIAESQDVEAEPQDYDLEVALIAAQSGDNARRVRARLEKQGLMDSLRNQIIERKVLELIKEEAKFKDVAYNPDESDTETLDFFIGGEPEADIPEAKHDDDRAPKQKIERD